MPARKVVVAGKLYQYLTAHGPVLNEVNTAPGFTAQSQVPRMFAATGMSFDALLELLVRDAQPV